MNFKKSAYIFIAIDEFTFVNKVVEKQIWREAMVGVLRQTALDGQASYIFGGIFNLIDIIGAGETARFANCNPEEIGRIEDNDAGID